jgi:hypothetical protein
VGDPAQDYLDSGGQSPHPLDAANDSTSAVATSGDPVQDFLDSGGKTAHPLGETAKVKAPYDPDELITHAATGALSTVVGGWKGLMELAKGNGVDAAAKAFEDEKAAGTSPITPNSQNEDIVNALGSKYNPLNWPGMAASKAGDATLNATGSPGIATAVNAGLNAVPLIFGGVFGRGGAEAEAASSVAPSVAVDASQAAREALLKRVGLTEARTSALQADPAAAANDYQESKLNSPNGLRMKSVIDSERNALSNHADSIVDDTGGTPGSAADESTRTERGNNILAPLDALKDHFDSATSALYKEADARAGGEPSPLGKFQDVLKDDSELTNSDRVHLVGGLNSYLDKLKMVGDDGSVSGNPMQAETVRKYLNENWSPQNSKLVGKLKDSLDDDVTQSAGDDVYAQARAMRALRARTLDDPDGISKIMDSSGPGGINRKVPVEKVADTITSMPVAQLNHVVGTLQNLPPELQESGDAAVNEIKAHMASKIADVGQGTQSLWNANGVTQAIAKNKQRLGALFDPDELSKIDDLNQAGQILKKDQSYPGAAAQTHNLMRQGAMGAITAGSTAAGHVVSGLTGIPGGEVAGAMAGAKMAGKFSDAAALRNVEKRIKQLD